MSSAVTVVLLYGGRSTEHEISCRSAAYVVQNLDPKEFDLAVIAITKDGRFVPQDSQTLRRLKPAVLPIEDKVAWTDTDKELLALFVPGSRPGKLDKSRLVVFPLLHGTGGEDGSIQGLMDLCELAYVGPDVLGSALAMDKILTKELAQTAGIAVVPYVWFRKEEWQGDQAGWVNRICQALAFPVFVKPARLGSSVGISKVADKASLAPAIDAALSFDDKVLIETGMTVREIEFAALGGYEPRISRGGEAIAKSGFYDYESKYLDPKASEVAIPAKISPELHKEGQEIARRVFQALNLYGLSRIDLFLTAQGRFYLNEVNTMPGFTSISQYPLLWRNEGLSESELLRALIQTALDRRATKAALGRSFARHV